MKRAGFTDEIQTKEISQRLVTPREVDRNDDSVTLLPGVDGVLEDHPALKQDLWKMMFVTFWVNMCTIFGYQALIIMQSYFKTTVKPNDVQLIDDWMMQANTITLTVTHLIFGIVLDIWGLFKAEWLIRFCMIIFLVVFILLISCQKIAVVIIIGSAITGFASAISEAALWIMAAKFPLHAAAKLRSMVSSANGFAGVFAVVLNAIVRGIVLAAEENNGNGEKNAERLSSYIFLGIFIAFLAISFFLSFWYTSRTSYIYYSAHEASVRKLNQKSMKLMSKRSLYSGRNAGEECETPAAFMAYADIGFPVDDDPHVSKTHFGGMRYLDLTLWVSIACPVSVIFFTLFESLLVWPTVSISQAFTPGVGLSGAFWSKPEALKWWASPGVIFSYNMFDFIGRTLPGTPLGKYFTLFGARVMASLRAVLICLIVLCVSPTMHEIHDSWLLLVFVGAVALTNGLVTTTCFMYGPRRAPHHLQREASSIHVLFLFGGICAGFFVSTPFLELVKSDGRAAVIFGACYCLFPFIGDAIELLPCSRRRIKQAQLERSRWLQGSDDVDAERSVRNVEILDS